MSTDADRSDGDVEKINVRVPRELLDAIDEAYAERGYASRSEAIRDALRTWVDPPVRLSEEVLADLAVSREHVEQGESVPVDDVRERLGLEDGED